MEEQGTSKTPWIIGAVIVVAMGIVIAYALTADRKSTKDAATQQTNTANEQKSTNENSKSEAPAPNDKNSDSVTITFTDNGFTPTDYTVKAGSKVTVKNSSAQPVQFSSNDHPTHTEETELNLPVIEPGEAANFTPTRVGTWGFHDHINDQFTGTLTVTE